MMNMRKRPSFGMREIIGNSSMPPTQQCLIVLPEHRRAGGTVTPPHKTAPDQKGAQCEGKCGCFGAGTRERLTALSGKSS